jgi:hypothetical protein
MSAKGDPFGEALPREQVLKQRGIDVAKEDFRFERKAELSKFTRDQEAQIEAVRVELTKAETLFRQANEMELPEEEFRAAAEAKRNELNDLVKKFTDMNVTSKTEKLTSNVRPSERHRRKDMDGHQSQHVVAEEGDGAFTAFVSNRRRRRNGQAEEQAY